MMMRYTLQLRNGMHVAISFPNKSRAYDATRHAVRFLGYDSAMEASFFIDEQALKHIQADMQFDEVGLLRAFDFNRDKIFATAAKVYARRHKGFYDLTAADF